MTLPGFRSLATAAILTLATAGPGAARDRTYLVGADGWRLERFGTNVAILRTGLTRLQAPSAVGWLLISCEGEQRRLRLTLPERVPELDNASGGRALIRPAMAGGGEPVALARLAFDGGRLISISGTGGALSSSSGDPVLRIARMLGARPVGLEWLVASGPGPIAPGRLAPLILALAFAPGEGHVLDDFAASCRPAGR